jgi:filamentous hemagglutinin family protein
MSAAVALALVSVNPAWMASSQAAPTGGQVAAGIATIQQSSAQSTIINQATSRAALNWQSFSVGAGESVVFRQPSASAVALNRVVGPDASVISGTLQANGHVFLVNPSGVLFSKGASVDVGGLVASTLAISNNDFMAGRYVFSGGAGSGAVVNEGSIRAADGGYVALIGNQVSNTGTIVANAGSVALGAGDTVLLDFGGDGLLNLKVNAAVAAARIDSGGVIQADGGRVIMSAQAKNALTATALNVDGIVRARGLVERNGQIFLDGGRSGVTQVSGALDASSANAGQKGGEIRVLGEYVGLFGNASLNASGVAGGGTVLVGGDFQGKNPDVQNAFRTYIGPDALIKADAIANGDGGKVIVWADDTTQFYGGISARGGAEGGNGGFVETSGKRVHALGAVDLGAARGRGGTWLLDPNNLTISGGADFRVSAGNPFQTTDDDAVLNATTLGNALTGGADVHVQTTNSGANTQGGTITVAATVTATGAATLSLDAQSDIIFIAAGQINSDGANALNVNLNAGSNATFTTPGTNASVITMANGSGIATSGGNVTATAQGNIQLAGINTGPGSLTVNTTSAGGITQASALTVGGATSLTAGAANDITLGDANNFGGAVSVASGNNVTLNDSNAIELGASTIGSLAVTATGAISITGAITATAGGAVNLTATGPSGSISESGAGLVNTTGTLTTNSVTGQTLNGTNNVGTLSATNTLSGAVSFNESDSVSVSGSNTGDGAFNVTANGGGTITVNAGNINANTGSVTLQADEMVLTGTITGNGGVTLRPNTAGAAITLGAGTAGLDFTNTVLQQVFTTGVLTIGADSAPAAGSITIGAPIAGGTNWTTLSLRTGAAVVDGNPAAGPDITVGNGVTQGNLAIRAVIGIGSSGDPLETSGGGNANGLNLAYSNTGGGGVAIANTGALTIASVDALTPSNGGTGATALSASSPMTIAADVIQAGTIDMTADEDPVPGPGDDLTVNTGVTVRSTGGDVILRAGDQVTLTGTALVESTGGTVTLIAGFNDNDGAGAITGAGRASAPNVVLDALTGVGSVGTRFNTTAGTLAARTRTSGDVFVTEFDGVILDTLGGVGNGTNGGGQYNLLAPGTIAINTTGSVSGAGVALTTTAGGDIALNGAVNGNAGDVALVSAGNITQTATGLVNSTGALTGSAATTAILDQANTLANLGPFTTSGNFTLNDTTGGLTLTGGVDAGAGAVSITTAGGPLALQSNNVSGIGGIVLQGAGVTSTGGTLATVAAANSGTPSGAIQVTATGTGAIDLAGAVASTGAHSNAGTASTGGNVTFTTNNGAIGVAAVDARGGDGTAGDVSGGNAGTIAFNVGGGNTLTLSGDQVSRGGDASGTGNAGSGQALNIAAPARLGADTGVITRRGAGAGAATDGAVTFGAALDSATATARNLTVTTAANTTFTGAVGGTNALGLLTVNGGGTTALNGGAVMTTGAQTYTDAVTLGAANTALTSTGNGAIGFAGTLDGASNLMVTTGGLTTFTGTVGGATPLTSLTTNGGGTTATNGGTVTTTDAQAYGDAVTLGMNSVFGSTGGGAIAFTGGIDGAVSLAVNTAGLTSFAGISGAVNPLASLVTDGAGQTSLAGSIASSGSQTFNDPVIVAGSAALTSATGNIAFGGTIDADAAANNRTLSVSAPAGTVTFSGNIGATQALADLDVVAGPTTIVFNGAGTQTVNVSAQGGNTATFDGPVVLATNLTVNGDGGLDNNITFTGTVNADAFANSRTLTVTSGTATTMFGAAVGNAQELGALTVSGTDLVLNGNVSVSGGGAVDLSGVSMIGFAPGIAIDTDRTGGTTPGGNVLFNALSRANPTAIAANLAIDASADNGAAAGNVQLGTIGNVTPLDTLAIVGDTVTFGGPVSARRVEITANTVVTPTGQINTSQGFNGTAEANAALLLRGLTTPGAFGTRNAPIRIDTPGLFVVIPNAPNSLPFVFLAGDPNKAPVYEFAGDPTHRRVFYNGAAPDSPADRAAQGAITQQLRALLDELAVAGFAKENIRKQLLQGIVLETGLARPGIDEFVGEGVGAPPSCEPGAKSAASGNLDCP